MSDGKLMRSWILIKMKYKYELSTKTTEPEYKVEDISIGVLKYKQDWELNSWKKSLIETWSWKTQKKRF